MKLLALLLALSLPLAALAQPGQKKQQMTPDQRQQMRQDMRDVYKDANRREQKPRQMAPQQREQLRRDVDEANRRMKR